MGGNMSAIAGIYQFNQEPVSIDHSNGIMKGLQKFPADDVQTWHNENIFLGCHAQWITPESVGERLPYYDQERRTAITADAIIDNREELFERLQVKQANRKQMSDSELILLAYHQWGEESPKYLIGDFAFMIWDVRKNLLFGARDFSGSRTLYFYSSHQRFAFCTIIQPLFSLPYIKKELNEQWLAEFLAIPGMHDSVDSFMSAYKNIEQIPPSHTISVSDGRVTFSRYCTLTEGEKLKLKSNQEYEEAFREVFQASVKARLRTRHKIGAHLSGGLDSGSVVSFAANSLRKENKLLHTFSYVPVDDFIDWTPKRRLADERPLIQSTVQHVGNIKDHYLNFEGKSPLSEVNDWLETLEMPYKSFANSFWTNGIYEEAHQQGVGVLLKGSRGNYTISWGHALEYYSKLLRKMKLLRLYNEINIYSKNIGAKKSRVISSVRKKAFPLISQFFLSKNQYHFPRLINPEFANKTNVYEKLSQHGVNIDNNSILSANEGRKKQFEQLFFWNINGINGTKLSLKYSLWERDPTNDLRVIRFCLSLPDEQYVQNGLDRALIRRSTVNFLPDDVRLNQRTRGIQGADAIHRMKSSWSAFVEELQELKSDPVISEFLNCRVIEDGISKVREGPRPEYVFDPEFKVLMRSLIVYRFIKNTFERG
jgi:asparagine synthase (glutamine-hydrolysing)